MITLLKPITVTQFGKSKTITTIDIKESTTNNEISKILTTITNIPIDKKEFTYSERLTLWQGVKAIDAPNPDPLEGTYFADRDTSDLGIENRIKAILNLRS